MSGIEFSSDYCKDFLPVLGLDFLCHPVITDSNPQFCKLNEVLFSDVFAEKEAKMERVTPLV